MVNLLKQRRVKEDLKPRNKLEIGVKAVRRQLGWEDLLNLLENTHNFKDNYVLLPQPQIKD